MKSRSALNWAIHRRVPGLCPHKYCNKSTKPHVMIPFTMLKEARHFGPVFTAVSQSQPHSGQGG